MIALLPLAGFLIVLLNGVATILSMVDMIFLKSVTRPLFNNSNASKCLVTSLLLPLKFCQMTRYECASTSSGATDNIWVNSSMAQSTLLL